MRKKKKAILLALIAIAGFASCSISNNNKNDDLEELSIVEVYTPRDSFIDDSIVLSTIFIRQHGIVDVISAIIIAECVAFLTNKYHFEHGFV